MRVYPFLLLSLFFSFWLMCHTFSTTSDTLYVSAKVYSDFGSLIPLIKYFPHGLNWPIHHPLFPGEPIRYHFLFYVLIGLLDSLHVPLSWSLNIPSALGFFSLLFLIYYFSRKLFKNSRAGYYSVILFLLNSSLSYLDFFKKYSLLNLPRLVEFVSFRPWNESLITAFWTLNIYTNQRHLAFSFAVCLLIVLILYILRGRYLYFVGFLFGSLLLLNQAGFLISAVFILFAFIFIPKLRVSLLHSFIGFIPWFLLYRGIYDLPSIPTLFLGYLSDRPLSIFNLVKFWFYNYGFLSLLVIPAVWPIFKTKLPLVLSLVLLFVMGNMFSFSPDIINNHKIFNFIFVILAIIISGLLIKLPRIFAVSVLLFSVLGGLVDFFPMINDHRIPLRLGADYVYYQSLPKNAVILNSTWFYHPASLAGLAIYNGYSYFTWSYGYNQSLREKTTQKLYSSVSISDFCRQVIRTPITHVEISLTPEQFLSVNYNIFKSHTPEYENQLTGLKVYSVSRLCAKI